VASDRFSPAPQQPLDADDPRAHADPTARANAQILPVGGGYRLLQPLGRGAFGEVWKAEAPGGIEVAVKLIARAAKPAEAQRELDALQLMRQLRHQNLLAVQAFFPLPDRLVIILELADGSLRGRLEQCVEQGLPGIPPAELLRYFREAAEALDYLHNQNVQHRDVKPDNLLLVGQHVKVADFGLAKLLERTQLQTASHAGTPVCMAPEVWNNKLSVHSDQYSLAVSYVQLRTGRFPFSGDSLVALMRAHLMDVPDLGFLGPHEQAALCHALSKKPEDRYPSCTDFVKALVTALMAERESLDTTAARPARKRTAPPPSSQATRPPSRRRTATPPPVQAGPSGAATQPPPPPQPVLVEAPGPAPDGSRDSRLLPPAPHPYAKLGLVAGLLTVGGLGLVVGGCLLVGGPRPTSARQGDGTNFQAKQGEAIPVEKDPRLQEWKEQMHKAKLLEEQAEYDQALELYEKVLKEGAHDEEVRRHVEDLRRRWAMKSDEHRKAREFIYGTWARAEDVAAMKENLPAARKAFLLCREAGDVLTVRKLQQVNIAHSVTVEKEVKQLQANNAEDVRKRNDILEVVLGLKIVSEEADDFVRKGASP
jgi:serine/threonine protein kinase